MNIRDLRYLLALKEHSHFGKAAESCFVSQPALSIQIKKLENHLGVQLLERTNKSVLLTDIGAMIAERAQHILTQVDELNEVAKLAQDPYSGEIKIGVFPTLAPYLLPLIIPQLTKSYPKLSFYLVEEQTTQLINKLKQGQLHAAILAAPVIEKNFNHTLLFKEEFLLGIPKLHPLAKKKVIQQYDLANEKLLLLEEGHCMRDQALALCHTLQIKEAQNFRATSLETLRHMVTAGIGITLMPKLACQISKSITYIPFTSPRPARSIGLFWRNASAKQELLQDLATKIKNILTNKNVVNIFIKEKE